MKGILYLKDDKEKTIVYYSNQNEEVNSINSFLNQLASINLFSLSVYREKVAKHIGIKKVIPIRFNNHTILFSVIDNNGIRYWINYIYLNEISYKNGHCIFTFKTGDLIRIPISKRKIEGVIAKINKIIDYINNI